MVFSRDSSCQNDGLFSSSHSSLWGSNSVFCPEENSENEVSRNNFDSMNVDGVNVKLFRCFMNYAPHYEDLFGVDVELLTARSS
jgi:hypothetical protein